MRNFLQTAAILVVVMLLAATMLICIITGTILATSAADAIDQFTVGDLDDLPLGAGGQPTPTP